MASQSDFNHRRKYLGFIRQSLVKNALENRAESKNAKNRKDYFVFLRYTLVKNALENAGSKLTETELKYLVRETGGTVEQILQIIKETEAKGEYHGKPIEK